MRKRNREFNEACNGDYDSFDGFCPCNEYECDFGRKIICSAISDDVPYITFLPRKISKTKRSYGIWTRGTGLERKSVYLRCPYCSWINAVRAKEVNSKGYVRVEEGAEYGLEDPEIHCVTCRNCRTHFWPFLKGWRIKEKKR